MASFIQTNCTSCADCESVCPTFSIFRGRNQFVIDTDTCEDCGYCILACQVSAIVGAVPPPVPVNEPKQESKAEEAKEVVPAESKPKA